MIALLVWLLETVVFSGFANDYLIDVWSADNGLPNSSVTAITQTPDGYLWIGTHNGLARFDGVRFVSFDPVNTPELKQARVRSLFVDRDGTLWINTYDNTLTSWRNGVFRHEYQAQHVAAMFSCSNGLLFAMQSGGLLHRQARRGEPVQWRWIGTTGRTTGSGYRDDRRGFLWYNTRDGKVGRLNLETLRSEVLADELGLAGQYVKHLAADVSGRISVGTDSGIASWNGERFVNQTPTNGEPVVDVSFLVCDREGGFWALAGNRVRKAVNREWIAEADSWGPLLGLRTLGLDAHEDRSGGVWFRHFGQGVFHLKPDGTARRISTADGLPGNRVTCWFQDREGNVWVGVDRGGLVRLRERRFEVIGQSQGLAASGAVSVCEDAAGVMWFGTYGGGLNRWNGEASAVFTLADEPTRGFFFSVVADANGRIWTSAGREDLFVLENGKFIEAPSPLHGTKSMLIDSRQRLWAGRANGIVCMDLARLTVTNLSASIEGASIHALAEDGQGRIWGGGENGLLFQYADGAFRQFRPEGNLAQQTIWALYPDPDGTLWIGTFRGGLLRLRDGRFTRYTAENGLPSDVICQILDDQRGNLWIGSHHGIFKVSKASLDAFARGEGKSVACVAYGLFDGLPTLECSGGYQPSACRSRDGRLWFATFKGVVSIQPEDFPKNQLPPPVVLEEVRVNGKPLATLLPALQSNLPIPGERQRIRPGKHYLEFYFTALSYAAPDKVRFRYRLEGLEDEWVQAGARREAHYSHLPPGDYTFRVIACNNDGVWNEAGAALALTIQPHFWQAWWFKGGMGAGVIGGIFGLVRFVATRKLRRKLELLKQQRAIERDRERIAKDIHDDLGAGLTQIMLQSAIGRNDSAEQMKLHLAQISETARELVRDMDETVWAIDPENDTLDGLVTYIGKFVQDFASSAQLRCRLDLPARLPGIPVPAEVRHNLFLAVKEALNNIIKHAQASEVFLQMQVEPGRFTFVLRDDGKGFVPGLVAAESAAGRLSSGHGLENLSERLKQIGGRCEVQTDPGRGTEIRLTVMIELSASAT